MAINWGTQQPIQPPSVVAQLPQQANGMDQFAGGLLSGIAQGQQIQSNNIALGQQRQQVQDEQALREAAGQGEDKWMQTLISQGQLDKAKSYQTQQLQYQNALLANKASILELNEKQAAKADRDNSINVAVMGAVSQLPPEQRGPAYQKYRSDMVKQYPGIVMPDSFSPDTFASVMRTNEVIQQTQTLKMTDDVSTLNTLQKQRDTLLSQKQQLLKEGKPTESIDQTLKEIQGMINSKAKLDDKSPDANALQQKVEYISSLKDKVENAPDEASKRKAQDELELALSQMKSEGWYDSIKSAASKIIGTGIGVVLNGIPDAPLPHNPAKAANSFTEGQVYQDANGNKAKYINGKWENI